MKKTLSAILVLALLGAMFAGCGAAAAPETTVPETTVSQTTAATEGTQTTVPAADGTLEEMINQITALQPVEFGAMVTTLDLSDTSEEGLWNIQRFTGLENADQITEAAVYEPMIGSIAFSLVLVRVAPDADSQAVAEAMKSGIDPRKWICVEADDLMVAGSGDVVMLIMVSSAQELTAQSYVDAFAQVAGQTDFVLN